jgi:hypothetical protein
MLLELPLLEMRLVSLLGLLAFYFLEFNSGATEIVPFITELRSF